LIDELHTFDEKDLQLFSILCQLCLHAMENAFYLRRSARGLASCKLTSKNLANIQNHLQDLAKKEIRYLEEKYSKFLNEKRRRKKNIRSQQLF